MKRSIATFSLGGLLLFSTTTTLFPASMDIVTRLSSPVTGQVATAYIPLIGDTTLDLGFGLEKTNSALYTTLTLGVGGWPIFGGIDSDLTITNHPHNTLGITQLLVSKTWFFKLTEEVNIGFTMDLVTIEFKGNESKNRFLSALYPVLGASLDF